MKGDGWYSFPPPKISDRAARAVHFLSAFYSNFPLSRAMAMAIAGPHADETCFKPGEGGEDIEEHLSYGIVRVVACPAEGQFHAAFLKLDGDGAGVRDGLGRWSSFGTTKVSP